VKRGSVITSALGAVLGFAPVSLAGCGGPQERDEAQVIYRAAFTAESGVTTRVTFPWITDPGASAVLAGMTVTDGGTFLVDPASGPGFVLEGRGRVEARFQSAKVQGLGNDGKTPDARLSREVPDGGPGDRYVLVNKGGAASAQVELEYTAERRCGAGCGGERSWTFGGAVGLSQQAISMQFREE
jgi:hypothetical protein